jgi:hypothetical protein
MKVVSKPRSRFDTVYRPPLCLVLQGAKQLVVGQEERLARAVQTLIVSADVPVAAHHRGDPEKPYVAVAIDLAVALLRELAVHMEATPAKSSSHTSTLFAVDTEAAALDCAARLVQLIDRHGAIPLLRAGIMQELHYWLLSVPHRAALRTLANPYGYAYRLAPAISILHAQYRSPLTIGRLATAAAMSTSNFHEHFKQVTSLTPR